MEWYTGTSVTAVQVSLFSLSFHIPFFGYQVASLQVVSLLVFFFFFMSVIIRHYVSL